MISYANATLEWNILMTMAFNHLPSSDPQELFGNCALVQSCVLQKWLDCVYIHLACGKIEQLYGGLPEDGALRDKRHWSC